MNYKLSRTFPAQVSIGLGALLVLALTSTQAQTTPSPALSAAAVSTPAAATFSPATQLISAPNGLQVNTLDARAEVQRAPKEARVQLLSSPTSLQQMGYNILVRRSLAHEATLAKLDQDPQVASTLALARERILSDARLAQLDQQSIPSAATLLKNATEIYQATPERFDVPAQTRASHILVEGTGPEALSKAQALLAQVRAGASFEALAKEHSLDKGSAAKGGDLGFFPAGKMVQPFEDGLKALAKPGDLSEPVLSEFGYHLIRLDERSDKSRKSLAEAREQLDAETTTNVRNEARAKAVKNISDSFVFDKAAIEASAAQATP